MKKRRVFVIIGILWIWVLTRWSINIFSYDNYGLGSEKLSDLISAGLYYDSPEEPCFTFIEDLTKPLASASEWLRQDEIKREIIKDKHINRQQYVKIIYKMELTRVIIVSIATLLTFFLFWYGFMQDKKQGVFS